MVKTPHFHCRGHGSDPWSGKFCTPRGVAKNKNKNKMWSKAYQNDLCYLSKNLVSYMLRFLDSKDYGRVQESALVMSAEWVFLCHQYL